MYDISPALAAALAGPGPGKVESWATLHRRSDGTQTGTLELASASYTLDATAGIRGSCQVTLPSLEGLTPTEAFTGTNRKFGDLNFGDGAFGDYRRRYLRGLLLPLTSEIRLFSRYQLPGTTTWETVPHGRYTVGDPTFADGPDGDGVSLTGYDYSADIAAAAWTEPFVIARGTNGATALTNLLQSRLPGLTVITPATSETTPRLVYAPGRQMGGNPWLDAQALAAAFGWVLYIDRDGRAVAEEAPSGVSGPPVWRLDDDGTAVRFDQTPSGADLVNTVIVFGEASGEDPVYVVVQDTDGPYGTTALGRVVAREYRSSLVRTESQAANAGLRMLRQWGQLIETVVIASHHAPHLEPGDLAGVTSTGLELDNDKYRITRVTVDLDPAADTTVTVSRAA